jgi:hypothetical protein
MLVEHIRLTTSLEVAAGHLGYRDVIVRKANVFDSADRGADSRVTAVRDIVRLGAAIRPPKLTELIPFGAITPTDHPSNGKDGAGDVTRSRWQNRSKKKNIKI